MTVKQLIKVLLTVEANVQEFVVIDEARKEHFVKDLVGLDPYANKEVLSFSKIPNTVGQFEIMLARH